MTMRNSTRHALRLLTAGVMLIVVVAAACSKEQAPKSLAGAAATTQLPEGHPSLAPAADLPEAARVLLDSGNIAFRAQRFADARKFYERAAQLAPKHGAPWFGIFMVGDATKNKALADSAIAEVQKRTGGAPTHPDTALRNPHAGLPKS